MTKAWHWSLIVGLFVVATASTGASAQSDTYPNKPVRFISDSAAGSSPDVGLRIVAEGLSQQWGQQVVVENRPGASGAISARAAADAIPDGYTLYAPALSTFLTLPGRAPNLPLMLPREIESWIASRDVASPPRTGTTPETSSIRCRAQTASCSRHRCTEERTPVR